ncbi:MAG TPA: rhodanese-like domain-containing protein [Methanoregulaceae archaeon]|nr:rhodanese-like domain-containing protein [Methanoregulaceae archaeon]HQJ87163.1 rhodanese-like domain-containing protein [Methanoregulaceae archaeon]
MWSSTLRTGFVILVLVIVLVACSGCSAVQSASSNETGGFSDLTVEQFKQKIEEYRDRPSDLVILDVRTPTEFERERLRDAVNLDVSAGVFKDRAARLDRDRTYLVYCQIGTRSAHAAAIMADLGFTKVYNMKGGIVKWKEAGNPTVRGA